MRQNWCQDGLDGGPLAALASALILLLLVSCRGAASSHIATGPPIGDTPPPSRGVANILTYHNDNARTGANLRETVLKPANVNKSDFGRINFFPVDGKVDGQPLYVSGLDINGRPHDVLYVATENDSVYAFDADSGTVLWKASLLGPGETPSDNRGCHQVTPEIGVTATPVIDLAAGPDGTIFLVAMSKDGAHHYYQRVHALDLATGAERPDSPVTVQASYPGTGDQSVNGRVIFNPAQYKERPGLLLVHRVVYTFWSSHCDFRPYTGWIIGYDANDLVRRSVLNITPNGSGGAIWASGAGPAAGPAGNIYFLVGNGTFDTTLDPRGFPVRHDYGNAFIKLATVSGQLNVADYFDMDNTVAESNADEDLGSGGVLLLPNVRDAEGKWRQLAVGAGKDRNIYVVDRHNMGKFNPRTNNVWQELPKGLGGSEFGMPAYFDNRVYYGAVDDVIRAFRINQAKLETMPVSKTTNIFPYPGATPSISADGTHDGIVWAVSNSAPAVLYAYDARNISHELYNSNQAGTRDQFGPGNKFITPTVANGKVFVGTTDGIAVFGLLH